MIGVVIIKLSNEDKIKTGLYKKNNSISNNKKVIKDFTNSQFFEGISNKKNGYKDNKMSKMEHQRRNRLIVTYRICQSKKTKILKETGYLPDVALDLIDKFRNILNTMLEEDDGVYPKNEILDVSRELDDIIYYYYKSSNQSSETL